MTVRERHASVAAESVEDKLVRRKIAFSAIILWLFFFLIFWAGLWFVGVLFAEAFIGVRTVLSDSFNGYAGGGFWVRCAAIANASGWLAAFAALIWLLLGALGRRR